MTRVKGVDPGAAAKLRVIGSIMSSGQAWCRLLVNGNALINARTSAMMVKFRTTIVALVPLPTTEVELHINTCAPAGTNSRGDLVTANALGALRAIATTATARTTVARPGERERRVTLPDKSLAPFVRLGQ